MIKEPFIGDGTIYVFDLISGEVVNSFPISGKYYYDTWSPDLTKLLGFKGGAQLTLYSIESQSFTRLTQFEEHDGTIHETINPSWSPDGKWIVYQSVLLDEPLGGGFRIYLIDTSCIDNATDCWDSTSAIILPNTHGPMLWSPDSRYILTIDIDDRILIYDLEKERVTSTIEIISDTEDIVFHAWTADSSHVVFTTHDYVLYIASLEDGKPVFLRDNVLNVKGWLYVPEP